MANRIRDFFADAVHWKGHFRRIKDAYGKEKKRAVLVFIASVMTTIVLLPLYVLFYILYTIELFTDVCVCFGGRGIIIWLVMMSSVMVLLYWGIYRLASFLWTPTIAIWLMIGMSVVPIIMTLILLIVEHIKK